MIKKEEFLFESSGRESQIHAVRWIPVSAEIQMILVIAHGMVEHINRYDEFAGFLAKRGILVTGCDHLGHGASIRNEEDFGYFGEKNDCNVLVRDIHILRKLTEERYPGIPCFLLGHSMGSFVVRKYLTAFGKGLQGSIIMGTGTKPAFLMKLGTVMTEILSTFYGWRHRSKLIDGMAFGGYNKKFRPARTPMDWLTRDNEIVDRTYADKRCCFIFTLNGYHNLFGLIEFTGRQENIEKIYSRLPIYILSGENDPVGDYGRGVREVRQQFKKAGLEHVDMKLYPEFRHEILNEIGREEVYEDIYLWMKSKI